MVMLNETIRTAVRGVARAVLLEGTLDGVGAAEPPIWDGDKEALKEELRQSLLLLKDGTWAVVPRSRSLVKRGEAYVLNVVMS